MRTKARDIERAIAVLEARLQRTPTEGEIADELGLDIPELRRVFDQVSFVHVAALDEMLGSADHGDGSTLGERLEDERTTAPGDALDDEETRHLLARVIHTLPSASRSWSPSTTTRASRWRRSVSCSASPRAGSASCTPRP